MKTTQMTPFFHLLFLLYLLVTFISEFENTLNSFSNSLLRSILVCKIPQFLQKLLIWTAHQTFPESRDTLRLPKIYIIFCLPAGAKYQLFQDPAHRLYGNLEKISYRAFLLFYYFFDAKKIAFKISFDLYFHVLVIEFFWFASVHFKFEENIHIY